MLIFRLIHSNLCDVMKESMDCVFMLSENVRFFCFKIVSSLTLLRYLSCNKCSTFVSVEPFINYQKKKKKWESCL